MWRWHRRATAIGAIPAVIVHRIRAVEAVVVVDGGVVMSRSEMDTGANQTPGSASAPMAGAMGGSAVTKEERQKPHLLPPWTRRETGAITPSQSHLTTSVLPQRLRARHVLPQCLNHPSQRQHTCRRRPLPHHPSQQQLTCRRRPLLPPSRQRRPRPCHHLLLRLPCQPQLM